MPHLNSDTRLLNILEVNVSYFYQIKEFTLNSIVVGGSTNQWLISLNLDKCNQTYLHGKIPLWVSDCGLWKCLYNSTLPDTHRHRRRKSWLCREARVWRESGESRLGWKCYRREASLGGIGKICRNCRLPQRSKHKKKAFLISFTFL